MPRQHKGKKREIGITVRHGREQPGSGAHSPARRTHWGQDATGATLGAGGHEAHRAPVPVETKTTSPWRKKGNETASGWGQRSLYRVIWEDLFDILSDTWNPRQGRSQCSRQFKIQEWAWHTRGTERLHEPEFRKTSRQGRWGCGGKRGRTHNRTFQPIDKFGFYSACNGKSVKKS